MRYKVDEKNEVTTQQEDFLRNFMLSKHLNSSNAIKTLES
jgi:hypothetical protein